MENFDITKYRSNLNGEERGNVSLSINCFNHLTSSTTEFVELPEDYKLILEDWITSGVESARFLELAQGIILIIGGKSIQISNIQEQKFWDGFFYEMLKLNIVQITGYSGKNHLTPIYKFSENLVYIKKKVKL